jgi:hypothetical protein
MGVNNVLSEKTLAFAIRIVNGYKYLVENKILADVTS